MILLIIKASIIIAIVLGFYKLVIEKESFFATNRLYFIVGLVLTFSLPFIALPKIIESQGIVSNVIESIHAPEPSAKEIPLNPRLQETTHKNVPLDLSNASDDVPTNITTTPSKFSLIDWIFFAYLFGVIILSINLIAQVLGLLLTVIKSTDKIHESKSIIINSKKMNEPCSFFNYIFINPELYELEIYEQIIAHEKIHIQKLHSVDLLLSEIAVVLLWFNPFIWLFRKEVEKNIEYQTDHHLIDNKQVKKDSYQMNLVRIATFKKPLTITTNYNQSLIKNRILKMNTKRSSSYSYWKYAFTIPLFFAVALLLNKPFTSLASQPYNEAITNPTELKEDTPLLNNYVYEDESKGASSECIQLLEAIRINDIDTIRQLLKSADVNCIDSSPVLNSSLPKNTNKLLIELVKSPLFVSARTGNVEIAKLLVAEGATIDLNYHGTGTPMITAAEYGHLDFLKYLLEQGVELDKPFTNQGSALIVASENGHQVIVEFLVRKGLDINYYSPNRGNALIASASNGYTKTVKYLLEKGMDINFVAPNQGNALIAASRNGHLETVKFLVSEEADIDIISENHGNALMSASNYGHMEIAQYLVSQGARTIKIKNHE